MQLFDFDQPPIRIITIHIRKEVSLDFTRFTLFTQKERLGDL